MIVSDLYKALMPYVEKTPAGQVFVLVDENTSAKCMPVVAEALGEVAYETIVIPAGESHKTLAAVEQIWNALYNHQATREALLLNVGGGMVTDLGGFAAATYKRGIRYVNIPTSLLAMVDASSGGKTGFNYLGVKNMIGSFAMPEDTLVYLPLLESLPVQEWLSGYAEMLKHGLISTTEHWADLLTFDWNCIDYEKLQTLVGQSVQIKEQVVEQDPFEKGIRKALNLGHTVGHAFESWAMENNCPVLHGYAVAWGLVCELYLSYLQVGFPKDRLRQTVQFIKEHYGALTFDCKQYDRLYEFMTHDKKNQSGIINFTLLGDIGDIRINQSASKEEIFEMLDFYRETMGC